MRILLSTLLIVILLSRIGYAEPMQQIDSLQAQLQVTKDAEKVNTLLALSEAYRNLIYNDCMDYGTQAFRLADKLNDENLKAMALKS